MSRMSLECGRLGCYGEKLAKQFLRLGPSLIRFCLKSGLRLPLDGTILFLSDAVCSVHRLRDLAFIRTVMRSPDPPAQEGCEAPTPSVGCRYPSWAGRLRSAPRIGTTLWQNSSGEKSARGTRALPSRRARYSPKCSDSTKIVLRRK
jgi:hypothetical protein